MAGNSIKEFICDNISKNNTYIINHANNYNNKIQELKNAGYNAKGYVVSVQPVVYSQAVNWNKANPDKTPKNVVPNDNSNACKKDYRSNRKYYKFNVAMKNIIEDGKKVGKYTNLTYLKLFVQIMAMPNGENGRYEFMKKYTTVDGIHWDDSTTDEWVNMMLNYTGEL